MHATTVGFEVLLSACVVADFEATRWSTGGHGFGYGGRRAVIHGTRACGDVLTRATSYNFVLDR